MGALLKQGERLAAVGLLLLLASCNGQETNHANEEQIAASLTRDSATASSAPVAIEPDSAIQSVEEITLKALGNTPEEMRFDKDTIEVKSGALVKLKLVNEAQDMPLVLNVVFSDSGTYKQVALAGAKIGASGSYVPNSPVIIAASPIALPGQTVEMEFSAPTIPGTYDFVCTYPKHWQLMNGKLLVK